MFFCDLSQSNLYIPPRHEITIFKLNINIHHTTIVLFCFVPSDRLIFMLYAHYCVFLYCAYVISPRTQQTLPSLHFTDQSKKKASEIILHPAWSSRLLISRSWCEKCFEVLKQLKGGRKRRGGGRRRRKSREQRVVTYRYIKGVLMYN